MANITQILAALANLPPANSAPTLAPPFVPGGPPPVTPTFPGGPQSPAPVSLGGAMPAPTGPPVAPAAPFDQSMIARRLALLGPAPTAPTPQPVSTLDKIGTVLSGVSAGLQGRGGEFVAGVNEQRQRPQREFEAKQKQYDQQRIALGESGISAAERDQERKTAQSQAAADKQFERELNERTRQLGIQDDVAKEKLRDALLTERQRKDDDRQAERAVAAAKAQQERDARTFASAYRKAGAGKFAKELADYDAGLTDKLSAEAAKWESAQVKLAEIRANRAANPGAGGTGSGQVMARLEGGQMVPAALVNKDSGTVIIEGNPVNVLEYVGGKIPAAQQGPSFAQRSQDARQATGGFGLPTMPWQTSAPQPAAPQSSGQTFTRAQVNAFARKSKRSPADVEADLKARGFNVQ